MEQYINILIGILVIAAIIVVLVKRPLTSKLSRWLLTHRLLVNRVAPFVFIAWGGAIWALMILKGDFSNLIAIVAASVIICIGVFFFFKRF